LAPSAILAEMLQPILHGPSICPELLTVKSVGQVEIYSTVSPSFTPQISATRM
jgi:hypothetical protein